MHGDRHLGSGLERPQLLYGQQRHIDIYILTMEPNVNGVDKRWNLIIGEFGAFDANCLYLVFWQTRWCILRHHEFSNWCIQTTLSLSDLLRTPSRAVALCRRRHNNTKRIAVFIAV